MAVNVLTGSPWEQKWHAKKDEQGNFLTSADALWQWVTSLDHNQDAIVNFGLDGGNDTQVNEVGLVLGHAYSLLGTV